MKTLTMFITLVALVAVSACKDPVAPSAEPCARLTWYDTTALRNRQGDSVGIVVWTHKPYGCP